VGVWSTLILRRNVRHHPMPVDRHIRERHRRDTIILAFAHFLYFTCCAESHHRILAKKATKQQCMLFFILFDCFASIDLTSRAPARFCVPYRYGFRSPVEWNLWDMNQIVSICFWCLFYFFVLDLSAICEGEG
jgi:hypothetical protein